MSKTDKQLRITWVKSAIGYSQVQKATIRALGLRRLGQSVLRPDNPSIRGMVQRVIHLVEMDEA